MSGPIIGPSLAQQFLNILANIKGDIAAGYSAENAILRANLVLDRQTRPCIEGRCMSDQRIKIENAIACAFGIGWNASRDGIVKASQEYIDKRNDCIHRYADEIESIRSATPSSDLVGAAQKLLDGLTTSSYQQAVVSWDDVKALRAALASTGTGVCEWERDDDDDDFNDRWMSGCGQDFMLEEHNTPIECGWKFCPYCSGEIKLKENGDGKL